eukprot:gene12217-3595_t
MAGFVDGRLIPNANIPKAKKLIASVKKTGLPLSPEVARTVILQMNELGMALMKQQHFREAQEVFDMAEVHTEEHYQQFFLSTSDRLALRNTTFNNLTCLYTRVARPEMALRYIEETMSIEESYGEVSPTTLLNLTAVLSSVQTRGNGSTIPTVRARTSSAVPLSTLPPPPHQS